MRKSRSRSRSRPRNIFNGRSKSVGRRSRSVVRARSSSIGSDLSAEDQFDILVFNSNKPKSPSIDRRSRSIFSYFTGDMDASTVSSLTADEYQYYGSAFPAASATTTSVSTSWCCCSDTTQPTSTTNATLSDYNTLVYRDGDADAEHDRGILDDTVAPPRRPRLKFGGWRKSANPKKTMSPSLFDALQEEDPYQPQQQEVSAPSHQRRRSRSMGIFGKRSSNNNNN